MQTFYYHVHVIAEDGLQSEVIRKRRVECNDKMHFMNKINHWNRMSMIGNCGYVYVIPTEEETYGLIHHYYEPRVSPDIYLDPSSSK